MYNDNPCYKCTSRYSICHTECPKYVEWSKKNSEKRKERMKQYLLDDDVSGIEAVRAKRIARHRGVQII
jgi:hypothetical protein